MDQWPLTDLAAIYGMRIIGHRNLGKILVIDTNRGRFALKATRLQHEELALEYDIIEHLVNKGFKQVARIVPTKFGTCYAEVGQRKFILTAWVNGEQANFSDPTQLELATRGLAEFHKAACGYDGRVYWQKRRLYGVWPQRFSFRLGHLKGYKHQVASRGIQTEFDQLFMDHVDPMIQQATKAITRLRSENYYKLALKYRNLGTICHHDYANHNILIDPLNKVWLIDFDYCILDMPLHDLGSLILRKVKSSNWSLKDAERILLIYHQEKPLEQGEMEVLLGFLEYPQDFWQLAWAYYSEVGMHKPESLLERLKKFLEYAEVRNQFLNKFPSLSL